MRTNMEQVKRPDICCCDVPGHVAVHLTRDEWARVYRRLIGEIDHWDWNGRGSLTRVIGEAGGVLEPEEDENERFQREVKAEMGRVFAEFVEWFWSNEKGTSA